MLGTVIKRIKECYKNEKVSPKFDASEIASKTNFGKK